MFRKKRYLYLDNDELSILLQSMLRLKHSLIQQGRYTDCVDELILKVTNCPTIYGCLITYRIAAYLSS